MQLNPWAEWTSGKCSSTWAGWTSGRAQMSSKICFAWPTWWKVEDASVSGAMETSASNMHMKWRNQSAWKLVGGHYRRLWRKLRAGSMSSSSTWQYTCHWKRNEAAKAKRQASIAALKPRLDALRLQRIRHWGIWWLPVSGTGLQCWIAGWSSRFQKPKLSVILKHCAGPLWRQNFFTLPFFPAVFGKYGTVVVLSDQEHEKERRFEPPPLVHSSVWGPEVYIVHLNNNHYEATCPLAKPCTKQERVKREPDNR